MLPSIALGPLAVGGRPCLVFAATRTPVLPPPVTPATNPFGLVVAGTGFVEPSTESSTQSTIAVGSQLPGVVAKVAVHIDQVVQAGDLLFELDKRQTEAQLKIHQAAVVAAEAQLSKLEKQPRPEEVPPLEAQVRANRSDVSARSSTSATAIASSIKTGAVTDEEMVAAEQGAQSAQAQVDVSRANLALLKAGAWQPDKVIAATAVQQAQAQVDQMLTQLALLEIRAPVTGTILADQCPAWRVDFGLARTIADCDGKS